LALHSPLPIFAKTAGESLGITPDALGSQLASSVKSTIQRLLNLTHHICQR
jgi:hypothetical protein